jgi:hypothetical protein
MRASSPNLPAPIHFKALFLLIVRLIPTLVRTVWSFRHAVYADDFHLLNAVSSEFFIPTILEVVFDGGTEKGRSCL